MSLYVLHNGVPLTPHPERAVFTAPDGTEVSLGQLVRERVAAGVTGPVEFETAHPRTVSSEETR